MLGAVVNVPPAIPTFHTWLLCYCPGSSVPTELPANVHPGKEAGDGLVPTKYLAPAIHMAGRRPRFSFWIPNFSLGQPWLL